MKKTVQSFALSALFLSVASTSFAFSGNQLTIWMGGDKAYKGMATLAEAFEKETGIDVVVETPENLPDRFQQSAATNKGPDIVLWAHDRFGEWAQSGLLADVKPSKELYNSIDAKGWQAISANGKLYGYPIAMEAIALIYNKKLIDTPPSSFEAMFDLGKQLWPKGVRAILWDQANPYFTMPLLAANGGYAFKETASGYDVKDVGVNNAGAKQGAAMLMRLIDEKVMPRGADYAVMESAFNKGESAMMISGPWAWANLDRSGIDYGVAALPSINGKPSQAFVGVWAAAINNASPNKDVAAEFVEEYLLTEKGLATLNQDRPLGAVPHKGYMAKLKSDPRIAVTYSNAINGMLMPNVPEMGKFWSAITPALSSMIAGQQTVDAALDNAAKQMLR